MPPSVGAVGDGWVGPAWGGVGWGVQTEHDGGVSPHYFCSLNSRLRPLC